jgi:hypothetical protein
VGATTKAEALRGESDSIIVRLTLHLVLLHHHPPPVGNLGLQRPLRNLLFDAQALSSVTTMAAVVDDDDDGDDNRDVDVDVDVDVDGGEEDGEDGEEHEEEDGEEKEEKAPYYFRHKRRY